MKKVQEGGKGSLRLVKKVKEAKCVPKGSRRFKKVQEGLRRFRKV